MTQVIYAKQYAQIVRLLREQGVSATDPQLALRFQVARATVLDGRQARIASQIPIDLPDLEDHTQAEIVKDNVIAVSALYFAAQLEELKF